jgi:hypothetical protein
MLVVTEGSAVAVGFSPAPGPSPEAYYYPHVVESGTGWRRSQVAAMSLKRCQPRQVTIGPGLPSPLRPKKPPSLAIQRTA